MVRCSGIGIDAAASTSTAGASTGTCSRATICAYASSSERRYSSASIVDDGAATAAGTGAGCGGGADVAHATKYNANIDSSQRVPVIASPLASHFRPAAAVSIYA